MQFIDLKAQYRALKEEINENIQKVLEEAHFISGPQVKELEDQLAEFVGRKHCISCANGTDALQIAFMLYGIGEGDAVFCSDITFIASTEPSKMLGAASVFCDIEPDTYNMSPAALERQIQAVLAEGKLKPKAVVAVDILGNPCDYDAIIPICEKYGLILIEDAAQSFGASYKGKRCCAFGQIATTSFFPAKPLGCYGDGGAIFTDNDEWAALIRSYAVHGKSGNDKYNNIRLGMNSRLDTVQAAILLPKLKAFEEYEVANVNQAAAWYTEALQDTNLILPYIPEGFLSSWAQYTVQLPVGTDRAALQAKLKEQGIPTMVYYPRPMRLQGAFEGTDSACADCPVTDRLCGTVLSLPMHPYLTKEQVNEVVTALKASL